MLILNLLSNQQKQELYQEEAHTFLKKMVLIIVLTVITISVFFVASKSIVTSQVQKYISETSSPDEILNKKIKSINSLSSFLTDIQAEHVNWSQLIIAVSKNIPADISLTSLKVDAKAKTFLVNGFSPTREDLLAFKDELSGMTQLENVALPIQNIAQKEDILFTITADLIIEEIN